LFVTLAVVGPLARPWRSDRSVARARFGLDQMPG
jgi:hypothetical protein